MKTDTPPEVLEEWNRLYRQLSAEERLKRGFALSEAARAMAESSLRKQYPDLSEQDFKQEFIRWLYGENIAAAVKERLSTSNLKNTNR